MDIQSQAVALPRITLPKSIFSISSLFILVGAACMVAAGFLLVEGLSRFSGDASTQTVLIVIGVLFQFCESLCFVGSAAFANSFIWRITLFSLGLVLFVASIAVMTLAQKTALETGETVAKAIDERTQNLRAQIQSLDASIESYRLNAEKQSQSIFKDSRELGQDSINRAVELETEKRNLSQELFRLTQERKGTSSDFFQRLEEVTGLPAKNTEFYFFVMRSLLIELCGVVMLSFGAAKRKEDELMVWTDPTRPDPVGSGLDPRSGNPTQLGSVPTEPVMLAHVKDEESDPTGLPLPTDADIFNEPEPMDIDTIEMIEKVENALSKPTKLWANSNVRQLREQRINDEGVDEKQEVEQMVSLICRLHREGEIASVGRDTVRKTINEHYGKSIGSRKAMEISKLVKQRLSMTPA